MSTKQEVGPGVDPGPLAFQPGWIGKIKRRFERRSMNKALASYLRLARDFHVNGLEAGSPQYQVLFRKSCDALDAYSRKWAVPLDELVTEVPALSALQRLAFPKSESAWLGRLVFAGSVLVAIFIGGSLILGLSAGVYAWAKSLLAG